MISNPVDQMEIYCVLTTNPDCYSGAPVISNTIILTP